MLVLEIQLQDPHHLSFFFATLSSKDVVAYFVTKCCTYCTVNFSCFDKICKRRGIKFYLLIINVITLYEKSYIHAIRIFTYLRKPGIVMMLHTIQAGIAMVL